jgi:cupin 2 domain-containing protein
MRSSPHSGAVQVRNLFTEVDTEPGTEHFDTLIEHPAWRLERIVSAGHATPADQWYDQAREEWVVLLRGRAALLFEDDPKPITLTPGDAVLIPAHRRHRVEWTEADEKTVWLALHFDRQQP